MKTTVTRKAYAKINLSLEVLARRSDGYHDLKSVMQTVQLCDQVTLTKTQGTELVLTADMDTVPLDERNTMAKAVRAFVQETGISVGGLTIHLEKHIPIAAGVGGGSSDAAAVLWGLNDLYETNKGAIELAKIAVEVGSDVPYCVYSGACLVEGKGEQVARLPGLPACWIVLCKPDFSLSTADMYQRIDDAAPRCKPDQVGLMLALDWEDLNEVAKRVENVFEAVLTEEERTTVSNIKTTMRDCGAAGAVMSGSGSLVYGIFADEAQAKKAVEVLQSTYAQVFLTQPV